ncbi:MAG: DUF2905 domain-containing protein [Firmicutes bacterium]|nr:DUF2905 domain-containing protein [Bacillota bacterium]
MGRALLVLGGTIFLAGLVFLFLGRIGLGRLPGDIIIKRESLTIYIPITTMILISIIMTLIFNLWRR